VTRISITGLLELSSPKTILYELLRPFGFTRQLSEQIYHSLSGASGKIFYAIESDYQLLKDRTSLLIYQKPEKTTEWYQIEENETSFENPAMHLTIQKVALNDLFNIEKSTLTATFDYEKIRFPLILRKWRTGDWFIPFGMKGRKKVSDYFSDHKFSLLQKSKTWVLCSEDNLIWIVGERADNRFRIDKNTKFALIIDFFCKKIDNK
jgi:tRNA(Ile)-lysidine synthase